MNTGLRCFAFTRHQAMLLNALFDAFAFVLRGPVILIIAMFIVDCSAGAQTLCYQPAEPFPYKLEKSDPLYEAARDEHQKNLEELEDYLNCLDRERSAALDELSNSYELFKKNYGKDAVFKTIAE